MKGKKERPLYGENMLKYRQHNYGQLHEGARGPEGCEQEGEGRRYERRTKDAERQSEENKKDNERT